MTATTVRTLAGLSGAKVLLMARDDRHWFVRKLARDPGFNARLRRQMDKQVAFTEAGLEEVGAPGVLDHGLHDGCFYFDMEYIRGVDGVSFLRRASYAEVIAFADRLSAYVQTIAARPPLLASRATPFEALYGKICDVQRRTNALDGETLARLFLALEALRRVGASVRPTLCHGDFTLENCVIDDEGRLWLLDLLDAPFEHYWQDLTKLHQDLEGGWYQLDGEPVAHSVLAYVSQRLIAAATKLDAGYLGVHAVLLACTFVRILPYVRTDAERRFVTHRIDHFARLASESEGAP
ncbi:MAG: phosphotransferase [Kofleriaceae bacterium]